VEGTSLLVRHLATELARRLGSLGEEEQLDLCKRVLETIGASGPESSIAAGEARQALLAVYRDATKPPRPRTPLSLSSLLTGAEGEPRLGSELEAEITTADRIDALVSFVTWEGWRRMSDAFQRFALDHRPLRLMTTTYTGATEAEAVEALARLPGAQVRVSYDVDGGVTDSKADGGTSSQRLNARLKLATSEYPSRWATSFTLR
jgi:hypothetical protein